jgi:hypothetical protein
MIAVVPAYTFLTSESIKLVSFREIRPQHHFRVVEVMPGLSSFTHYFERYVEGVEVKTMTSTIDFNSGNFSD